MPLAEVAAGGLLAKETRQETKNPRRKEEWAAVSGKVRALAPAREGKKSCTPGPKGGRRLHASWGVGVSL